MKVEQVVVDIKFLFVVGVHLSLLTNFVEKLILIECFLVRCIIETRIVAAFDCFSLLHLNSPI